MWVIVIGDLLLGSDAVLGLLSSLLYSRERQGELKGSSAHLLSVRAVARKGCASRLSCRFGYLSGKCSTSKNSFPLVKPPKGTHLSEPGSCTYRRHLRTDTPGCSCCSARTVTFLGSRTLAAPSSISPNVACSLNHSHLLLALLFYSPFELNFLFKGN